MGLAGARNAAVTGLQAQSTGISISADNIANAGTTGYKAVRGLFSTLVTNTAGSASYSSGGVSVTAKPLIEKQGLIQSTGRATDLAISGNGFFAVQDSGGTTLLTRAGSFDVNNVGQLVNTGNYKLLAWPLDDQGRLPGTVGNTTYTTSFASADSLVPVDINTASGTASATTAIDIGMNLNAGQSIFQGSGVTINPASTANDSLHSDYIIIPGSGMEEGDSITFNAGGLSANDHTFTYGGFAKSADVAVTGGVYGSILTSTAFTAGTTLANGDQFKISTVQSGAATFTYKATISDTTQPQGDFNSLDSLAIAINKVPGLTARTSGGRLYVSSTDPNDAITFTNVGTSTLVSGLGFSDEPAASGTTNRFNSMDSLYSLVTATSGVAALNAVINNPTTNATIDVFSKDPLLNFTVTKNYDQVDVDLSSAENGANAQNDVIVPVRGSDMVSEIGDGTGIGAGVSTVSFNDGTNSGTYSYGGVGVSKDVSAGIFGATTASGVFSAGGGLANGVTITFSDGTITQQVTCNLLTTPGTGQFNSLNTLATAISSAGLFSAKVVNGKLYISTTDTGVGAAAGANRPIGVSATTGGITGANIVAALGGDFGGAAANTCTIVAAQDIAGGANERFSTLAQLDALLAADGFTTTLTTGTNASIAVEGAAQITVGGANNADLLAELGLAAGASGDGFFTELGIDGTVAAGAQTATIDPDYDPSNPNLNMSGGRITPHFTRNVRIFDQLGTGHDFSLDFLNAGANNWAVELHAANPSEILGGTSDGLVASGNITFNGDGTLATVGTGFTDISITWAPVAGGQSDPTSFSFDFGTVGATDGMRQFDAAYNVDFLNQNGVEAGQFKGISMEADGTINALFSNGQIKAIYKLPIITVADQNSLAPKTGNVFEITQASGEVNLKLAGQGGAGVIVPSSLEGSTSDIAEELTSTIGIQSNYNANATLISTIKAMEDELNRRL